MASIPSDQLEGVHDVAVFDIDNDGWPDVYIGAAEYPGNKALLFHQSEALVFERLEVAHHVLVGVALETS